MYNRTNGDYNKKATAVNRQTSPVLTILLYSVEARFPDSRYYESPAGVLSSDRAAFALPSRSAAQFYPPHKNPGIPVYIKKTEQDTFLYSVIITL
ncbi:MAG: hypothetical protein MR000_10155 [Cloacibacillus porcorum]|nr:hypothetical protein [Cloacibacillus porcorum]